MFQKLKDKILIKKEDRIPYLISLAITLVFFAGVHFLGNYFFEVMWIIIAILLAILISIISIYAGFAVLKSLFLVAAELSLLIYLAQSYCSVSGHTTSSDAALKSLVSLGLLYIAISFFRSLYGIAKTHYKKVEKERWHKEKIMTVSLYLIFAGMFTWEIFLIMKPIILGLCVAILN